MNPDAGTPHGPADAAPPASLPFELPHPGGLAALSDMLTGGLPVGERTSSARSRRLALSLAARLQRAERSEGVADTPDDGRLVIDPVLLAEADRDQNVYLGRIFTRHLTRAVPDVVFLPADTMEVVEALRWARETATPVTVRGAASAALGGAVPNDGGLVLDLSHLDKADIDPAGEVCVVGAGARLRRVHRALARRGLALPVYPSNLGATLTGWLTTGGAGLNAFGPGSVLDIVRAADVVLPDGELVRFHCRRAPRRRRPTGGARPARRRRPTGGARPPRRRCPAGGARPSRGRPRPGRGLVCRTRPAAVRPRRPGRQRRHPRRDHPARRGGGAAARDRRLPAGLRRPDRRPAGRRFHRGPRRHQPAASGEPRVRLGGPPPARCPGGRRRRPPGLAALPGRPDGRRRHALAARSSARASSAWVWRRTAGHRWRRRPPAPSSMSTSSRPVRRAASRRASTTCPASPPCWPTKASRSRPTRFRPQQTKRLGPGLLAAEIELPAGEVAAFLAGAERLAHGAGVALEHEVYYLTGDRALVIAGYLTDHRSMAFLLDLALTPALLDLAVRRYGAPALRAGPLAGFVCPRQVRRRGSGASHRDQEGTRSRPAARSRRAVRPGAARTAGAARGEGVPSRRAPGRLAWRTPGLAATMRLVRAALRYVPGSAHGHGRPVRPGLADAGPGTAAAGAAASLPVLARALHCVNCGECNVVCPVYDSGSAIRPAADAHPVMASSPTPGDRARPRQVRRGLLDLCHALRQLRGGVQAGIPPPRDVRRPR